MELDYFICKPCEFAADSVIFFVQDDDKSVDRVKSELAEIDANQLELIFTNFHGESKEARSFYGKIKSQLINYIFVGIGKPDKVTIESIRKASALACKKARDAKSKTIGVYLSTLDNVNPSEMACAIVEGAKLGLYKYDKYKSKKKDAVERLTLAHRNPDTTMTVEPYAQKAFDLCYYVNFARDLGNAPAGELNPQTFAEIIQKSTSNLPIECEILDISAIKKEGMTGLLNVGAGSDNPPVFAVLKYNGGRSSEKPIALVGKGVTFDSGGLNIKTGGSMEYMQIDMHGAASAFCATLALAQAKAPINVVCLLPICENLINGSAYKPGDILRFANGKTVEANNTDAEGRLILADALIYAQKFEPQAIIDLATLTGSVAVAFGAETSALFCNNETLADKIQKAAIATEERVWRMPLYEEYKEYIKSEVADIKNHAGRWGGVCTAASFLEEFVGANKWAHLDIASTAIIEKERDYISAGASGYGVRLIFETLKNWNDK